MTELTATPVLPIMDAPPMLSLMPSADVVLPSKLVANVFDRLAGQFGVKLTELYVGTSSTVVQSEWAHGLTRFSDEEIATGLSASQMLKDAPILGEFLHLCRPSLNPEIAWYEASLSLSARERGEPVVWSHPAVFRSALTLRDSLRQGSFLTCSNRWDAVLRTEFAKGWGEGVPEWRASPVQDEMPATPMPESVRRLLKSRGFLRGRSPLAISEVDV